MSPRRTMIVIDRSRFSVKLYKRKALRTTWKLVAKYGCAVGDSEHYTPPDVYNVVSKFEHPDWKMPDSDWIAKEDRGRIVPGRIEDPPDSGNLVPNPANPLKARWLGLHDGIGIHGTDQIYSIGRAESHGCIRMLVADVKDLYRRTPEGTPVVID